MTTATDTTAACPSCGAPALPGDRFCEACGADLPAPATAPSEPAAAPSEPAAATPAPSGPCGCGGTFVDGWCDECGAKAPDPRDHVEVDLDAALAGCSDRGRRHHRNEDAMALGRLPGGGVAAVVSDGVSSTVDPHVASQAAVDAALSTLAAGRGLGAAHAAAQAAAAAVPFTPRPGFEAPSCTFLAAAVSADGHIDLAALGDCRAYWVGDDGDARQLTRDDSWAEQQVAAGAMTHAEAHGHANAHVITRWLGSDADPAWTPEITTVTPGQPGHLILCTDGLWNHLLTPEDLADRVPFAGSPVETARSLITFANDAGGHDNATVVVIAVPPAAQGPGMPRREPRAERRPPGGRAPSGSRSGSPGPGATASTTDDEEATP